MGATPIFVVSGGAGVIGEQMARVVLSQFQDSDTPVVVTPQVRRPEQLDDVIAHAATSRGMIFHTMVDAEMRRRLITLAYEHNVVEFDLIGDILDHLARLFGRAPLGLPGLYHQQHDAYFDRLEAIAYTVGHDDGRKTNELDLADIVLAGISRVGKTPISMYLAVLGWKVANVALVRGIEPPAELFEIDRRRVIGLIVSPEQILARRRWRQKAMGVPLGSEYTDLEALEEEMNWSKRLFRRQNFAYVNLTDKSIEESADEIMGLITRWFIHRRGAPPSI